jgi:hypothetical protein
MKVACVLRLEDQKGEATETREGGFKIIITETRGMCYRHNLAEPEGEPRTRWTQKMNTINLRIGSCADVWMAKSAMFLV